MKPKSEIVKQFKDHYNYSKSGCRNQWRHIEECRSFYNGDYMNYRDDVLYGKGSSRKVKEVSFNRVKPYVNSVVGFFAQQRRKPTYSAKIPDNQEQAAYSDYLNGYSDYIRDNANAEQMETRQDLDLIVGGIGATDTAITTKQGTATRLPGGEVIEERVDMLHVGYDPEAVHPNLLDSRWVYRAKDYDVEEAEELFNKEEEDFEVAPEEENIDFKFNPYGGITDKIGYEWADSDRRMVRVYFYHWFEVENFYRVENPIFEADEITARMLQVAFSGIEQEEDIFSFDPTAKILTVTKDIKKQVKEIFDAFDIPFETVAEKRKIYYTAIISGDKCFDAYKAVTQEGYTIKFKTGDRDETNRIWTGLVASMRDPQRYYNKSLTELMLIIASNSRGGVMYEEDAIDNIQKFERDYARTASAVKVRSGAISGGKIKSKAEPQLPTGYENILQLSGAALTQVTGIDESFFGAISGGNETAMLQRQRIKQATTTLAIYMDSIVLYTKEQARMMLSFIRLLAESNEGSYFNMKNDEGGLIYETVSPDFLVDEYDIVIGEAPDTATQKEYYTQTLITLGQSMQAIGDPRYSQIFALAVKQMPLPERDKSAITKVLLEGEENDPEKQQMQAALQQGQQMIQLMQQQITEMGLRLANKEGELAIKAKAEADKNKNEEEKNDLKRLEINIEREKNKLKEMEITLDSLYKTRELTIKKQG